MNQVPYQIKRYFDGVDVMWVLTKDSQPYEVFECREDAEYERGRLNSANVLDELGIF